MTITFTQSFTLDESTKDLLHFTILGLCRHVLDMAPVWDKFVIHSKAIVCQDVELKGDITIGPSGIIEEGAIIVNRFVTGSSVPFILCSLIPGGERSCVSGTTTFLKYAAVRPLSLLLFHATDRDVVAKGLNARP